MEKIFHGSAGYSSVLDHMIEGKGIYASMFDKSDLDMNRENNDLRKVGYNLELKSLFHLNESKLRWLTMTMLFVFACIVC